MLTNIRLLYIFLDLLLDRTLLKKEKIVRNRHDFLPSEEIRNSIRERGFLTHTVPVISQPKISFSNYVSSTVILLIIDHIKA